jgi:epoxyqueuosine reductase QueG
MNKPEALRQEIISFAREQGADITGFARVEKWAETAEVPQEFWPQELWPLAKTVIALGMAMPLPIVETTPSAIHMELYNTCNRELNSLAYRLTLWLNRQGQPSIFFPRDCYGSIKILLEKPFAAFGHVPAAKYAGLGTLGLSHLLLTPAFGPRVRFVSVFTAAVLENSPPQVKELCIKCQACIKCCPPNALKASPSWWGASRLRQNCLRPKSV